MRDRIEAALKSSKADYTEIRIEEREATTVAYRGKDLETASAVIDAGGIVRCLCRDGGWGVATFNDRDDLLTRVEQAYQCARVAQSEEPIELAPIPVSEDRITVTLEHDFRGISVGDKKALVEAYNNILLGLSDSIVDTTCNYGDTFSRVFFANSQGTFIEEERPMISLRLFAIARDGDNVQTAIETLAGQNGFDFVQGREGLAQAAAQRAVDILTVFDDGSLPGLRGTHKYDDEGTPTRRTDLIKHGILVGRLHSRETAAKMGESVSGNARATSYRYPPIVRMTNTAIEAGETSFEDMIKAIKLGIYACDTQGGQTALENFSFSSAYAHMIRDGEIAEMVKDVILAGNLFTTLMNIDAIGDDFEWSQRGGTCGKGQGGLAVTFGAPHIRIRDVVIGGK
jgi:TldD protein